MIPADQTGESVTTEGVVDTILNIVTMETFLKQLKVA